MGTTDSAGKTALFFAVKADEMQSVRVLLNAKAQAAVCDNNGQTPLFYVSNSAAVELLVSHKCNVNCQDPEKRTALFRFARQGNQEILQALLLMRGDPEVAD